MGNTVSEEKKEEKAVPEREVKKRARDEVDQDEEESKEVDDEDIGMVQYRILVLKHVLENGNATILKAAIDIKLAEGKCKDEEMKKSLELKAGQIERNIELRDKIIQEIINGERKLQKLSE